MTGSKVTVKKLVSILKGLPEKKFLITALAHEVMAPDGTIDMAKALEKQHDLNLAVTEIKDYIRATRDIADSINNAGRDNWDFDRFDYDDFNEDMEDGE